MKILIISSADPIFLNIARYFASLLNDSHDVLLVKEKVSNAALTILKQRINRAGLLRGLSQFLFKVYDLYILRQKHTRRAASGLSNYQCDEIHSINSVNSQKLIGNYDIAICLATSIVKEASLNASRYGLINVHPGILPNYRGIGNFWAVLNNDWPNIGCTCHWMTGQIDIGKIISIKKIGPEFETLWDMNILAMTAGVESLSDIINSGHLLSTSVSINQSESKYYSWYGFREYMKFMNSVKLTHKSK